MQTKRLGVVFKQTEFEILKEKAKEERKSVAELIRTAVEEKYLLSTKREKIKALNRLFSPDREIHFPPWGELKKELDEEVNREVETH